MTALVVAAAVAALVAVAGVLGDRLVRAEAERRAAEYLAVPLGPSARVRLHGTPFLTQAVRGRYRTMEVTAASFDLGVLHDTALHAHLINAYLPLRSLLGRRVRELPVESVQGEVVIPYRELARVSRIPALRLEYRSDRLMADAALPVPGISQLARISGEAVATITGSGAVLVRIREVSLAALPRPAPVLSQVLNQLIPTLTFTVPLPRLPYGLRIDRLVARPGGLQVVGSAEAAVLRRPPHPVR